MRRALIVRTLVAALAATGIVGVSGYAWSYGAPHAPWQQGAAQGERRPTPATQARGHARGATRHHKSTSHRKKIIHRVKAVVHRNGALVGPCPHPSRDTTNPGCHIVLLHVTITFPPCPPTCKPLVLHTKSNAAYPNGLYAVVLRPKGNDHGIQTGDTFNILINKYGQFALDAADQNGTVLKSFVPPVALAPPSGLPHLQRLTAHGWVTVPHNLVYSPGLFQWHA